MKKSSNCCGFYWKKVHFGQAKWTSLRPEAILINGDGPLAAQVVSRSFIGAANRVMVEAEGTRINVMLPANQPAPEVGAAVRLGWNTADVHAMDGEA